MKLTTEARRQANARQAGGNASRERHKRKPIEMDWDAAITRLRAMLDELEAK
jgi:hypothetical protein